MVVYEVAWVYSFADNISGDNSKWLVYVPLTSSLVAKISDLGNARIVNMQPGQLARTLTRVYTRNTCVYASWIISSCSTHNTVLDWTSSHLATLQSSPSHMSEGLRVVRHSLCSEDIALTEGEHDKKLLSCIKKGRIIQQKRLLWSAMNILFV